MNANEIDQILKVGLTQTHYMHTAYTLATYDNGWSMTFHSPNTTYIIALGATVADAIEDMAKLLIQEGWVRREWLKEQAT